MRKPSIIVVFVVVVLASSSQARTWRVEKDGSGDFSVIYEAVDVCAAGDTILVGAGHFEEYRREPDYLWSAYCCVHTRVSDITIIGSGVESTMIGLDHFDPNYQHYVIGISCAHYDLTVENLTVNGVFEGVQFEGPNLSLKNCTFSDCEIGVATWGAATNSIQNCLFVGYHDEGVFGAHPNGVTISDCEFYDGSGAYAISAVGGNGWAIRDCVIHDCTAGIHLESGASGVVERCHVQTAGGGGAPAIEVIDGAVFSICDSVFMAEIETAIFMTNGTVVTVRNSIFQGGTWATIEIGLTPMDFHGNHIINGGGRSVLARWQRGSLQQPYDLDLTGNYWGSDDGAQIATWIEDYNDHHPMESGYYVVVRYAPFEDQPVQTEQTSWGAVKSLFK